MRHGLILRVAEARIMPAACGESAVRGYFFPGVLPMNLLNSMTMKMPDTR